MQQSSATADICLLRANSLVFFKKGNNREQEFIRHILYRRAGIGQTILTFTTKVNDFFDNR